MKPYNPKISIIIPVLNEADCIGSLLAHLKKSNSSNTIEEILVIDGGSSDATIQLAQKSGAVVVHSEKGRAKQMNLGAQHARGEILYFLHVDTLPPVNFDWSIISAIKMKYEVGCFRLCFDSNSPFLRFFAWFTKLNHNICRGGDQSLFITKDLFFKHKGFNENYIIFEDNEFIQRLNKDNAFKILPEKVRTSARKYEKMGIVKLQYHFGMIHLKKFLGAGPDQLYQYYKRNISA